MKCLPLIAALSVAGLTPVSAPAATLTTLYTFSGGADGGNPGAALVPGRRGRFYSTTVSGNGTVFELTPPADGSREDWSYTRLHSFTGPAAAHGPFGNPLVDDHGAIYGIAYSGGATAPSGCAPFSGCGEVFKLERPAPWASSWVKSTVWTFDGLDGTGAFNSLSMDDDGNLYGMTNEGGNSAANCRHLPARQRDAASHSSSSARASQTTRGRSRSSGISPATPMVAIRPTRRSSCSATAI